MLLDSHEVESNEEIEKEKENKREVIRNIKRAVGRNRDFRHMNNNMGKGKKIVLRSMREEDVSANEGMINHNKKEI